MVLHKEGCAEILDMLENLLHPFYFLYNYKKNVYINRKKKLQ